MNITTAVSVTVTAVIYIVLYPLLFSPNKPSVDNVLSKELETQPVLCHSNWSRNAFGGFDLRLYLSKCMQPILPKLQ